MWTKMKKNWCHFAIWPLISISDHISDQLPKLYIFLEMNKPASV